MVTAPGGGVVGLGRRHGRRDRRRRSGRSDKAGIDSPLGWPSAFVSFVARHSAGSVSPPAPGGGALWRRGLAYRMTDEVVRASTGLIPMSVSADRIGHAAFRAAGLLALLSSDGCRCPAPGTGWSWRSIRQGPCSAGA